MILENESSLKTIGVVGIWPTADEAAASVGSWMVTSGEVFGILIGFLHFGHGPVWPANLSLTLNRAWHVGQTTEIAIKKLCGEKVKKTVSGKRMLALGSIFQIVFENTKNFYFYGTERGVE